MHETLLLNNRKDLIVVWFNPNTRTYYYRYVTGIYQDYYVGYKNQYDHVVILIIKLVHGSSRQPLKKRLIRSLISYLEKVERR